MNRETHLKLLEEKMAKNLDVAKRKNSDYCGKNEDDDPFKNFRLANTLSSGRVSVEDSIFTRLTDKVARVGTLLGQDAQVVDESIQDALGDLSNYALILSNYLDSKSFTFNSKKPKTLPPTVHPMDEESDDTDLFYKVGDRVKVVSFINRNGTDSSWVKDYGVRLNKTYIVSFNEGPHNFAIETKSTRRVFISYCMVEKA